MSCKSEPAIVTMVVAVCDQALAELDPEDPKLGPLVSQIARTRETRTGRAPGIHSARPRFWAAASGHAKVQAFETAWLASTASLQAVGRPWDDVHAMPGENAAVDEKIP